MYPGLNPVLACTLPVLLLCLGCRLENSDGGTVGFAASSTILSILAQSTAVTATDTQIGLYCGSSPNVSGALGGWTGVREYCKDTCDDSPTAHMCTMHELAISLQFSKGYASLNYVQWIAGWGAGAVIGGRITSECQGWTSASPVYSASMADLDLIPAAGSCDQSRSIACCDYVSISTLTN